MDKRKSLRIIQIQEALWRTQLNNVNPLISSSEELYISEEAKKENALAREGKSCRPEKVNMPVTTSQYEIYLMQ